MFNWLSPWILVPSLIVSPICQILLFAYIGRSAGVGDDEFYVIGNALNYAAIPCLFAMSATIEGEREGQHPRASCSRPRRARIPLFLGRALPVILNGWGVAMVGVVCRGAAARRRTCPAGAWPPLAARRRRDLGLVHRARPGHGRGGAAGPRGRGARQRALLRAAGVLRGQRRGRRPARLDGRDRAVAAAHARRSRRRARSPTARTLRTSATWSLRELGIGVLYAVVGLVLLR